MIPTRLRGFERRADKGVTVLVADTFLSRLLGLSFLDDWPCCCALLLPRCSSVHTFGMRFALDVTFLDAQGNPLRIVRHVQPWRFVRHRGAAAVLERRAEATP